MRASVGIGTLVCFGVLVTFTASLPAQRGGSSPPSASAANTTGRIVTAAQTFLNTLDEAGRVKVQFPFGSPQKTRWSNLPGPMFQREGLRLGDLTPPQRSAAMGLLQAAFSADGYNKVTAIMHGDEILRTTGGGAPRGGGGLGRGGPGSPGGAARGEPGGQGGGRAGGGASFGEDQYYIAFVGVPSATTPWTLQFGGHHLAINMTLAASRATLAPSHTGAQPATYTVEGRTVRPLGKEVDKAFSLMASLDAAQRSKAILNYQVSDLVLGPGQDGRTIQPEGIPAASLTAAQQTMLLDLTREWVGIANDALAAPRMDEIRANLSQTYFAWSGPTTEGSAAYFRVQGPTLVIEYAPQRGVDHIHTIYRDPTNDYGAAFAR